MMVETILGYEINLHQCPLCEENKNIKATGESERECVTFLIGHLKNHFRTCQNKKETQVEVKFKLQVRKKFLVSTLTTFETTYLDRKVFI